MASVRSPPARRVPARHVTYALRRSRTLSLSARFFFGFWKICIPPFRSQLTCGEDPESTSTLMPDGSRTVGSFLRRSFWERDGLICALCLMDALLFHYHVSSTSGQDGPNPFTSSYLNSFFLVHWASLFETGNLNPTRPLFQGRIYSTKRKDEPLS